MRAKVRFSDVIATVRFRDLIGTVRLNYATRTTRFNDVMCTATLISHILLCSLMPWAQLDSMTTAVLFRFSDVTGTATLRGVTCSARLTDATATTGLNDARILLDSVTSQVRLHSLRQRHSFIQ